MTPVPSDEVRPATKRPSDAHLEALLEDATPGPWMADQCWLRGPHDVFMGGFGHGDIPRDEKVASAHLCAYARLLAEEVLELRAKQGADR